MNLFKMLPPEKQEKLLRAFGRDATKAIAALREGLAANDIELLTGTFHSMKSALGNIGEQEKSDMAKALEMAGKDNDMAYITANAEEFIAILSEMTYSESDEASSQNGDDNSAAEDTAHTAERLRIVKLACDNYDDKTASSMLADLLKKPLKRETKAFVLQIKDILYSDSDFDAVSEKINVFLMKI